MLMLVIGGRVGSGVGVGMGAWVDVSMEGGARGEGCDEEGSVSDCDGAAADCNLRLMVD